jgi:lipopolysaccharide biosynthesis glycosyltransferase
MSSSDKWVLVFLSNEPYIRKAFSSIKMVRNEGQWKDDIVLLVSSDIYNNQYFQDKFNKLDVILKEVPNRNFDNNLNLWRRNPENTHCSYVLQRGFMYNKFCAFDTYFRKWDKVFYLDSGAKIHGSLDRLKKQCSPDNCIYAHSDAYPTFTWKMKNQFDIDLFEDKGNKAEFIETYGSFLDKDYFQGTMFIYDTRILNDDTMNRLFELNEKYPIAVRMDQGILNLYFTCERNLWKQIPVKDEIGFLYDFHERDGFRGRDYLILKYPRFEY